MKPNVMPSPLPLRDVVINDAFFSPRIENARTVAIPYMWKALNDELEGVPQSCALANFRVAAGLEKGAHGGCVFQDSDVYKWLEGVAYSLETTPDAALEARADEVVSLIEKAQRDDGYLCTYYQINDLSKRWTNLRDHHELYMAGHLMEAAVAYKSATGKDALLNVAIRLADHIDTVFGPDKKRGYPGHEEVELGLCKLYAQTGNEKYLRLADFFLRTRGEQPYYFDGEAEARGEKTAGFARDHGTAPYSYMQAHAPVLSQQTVTGHAVRAGYLLSGMADVARYTEQADMKEAVLRLFADATEKQMYITGGIGSMRHGEAFTFDYDLPNDHMYSETCAAISLLMTAQRLCDMTRSARCADIAERVLYNGMLSGISLDGTKYFYVNPLENWPQRNRLRQDMGVDSVRQGWFGCACCPPNILRTLTGLGKYIYSASDTTVYVNQYIGSTARITLRSGSLTLAQSGQYPWDGHIRVRVDCDAPMDYTLALRVPFWCADASLKINGMPADVIIENGYWMVRRAFAQNDVLELSLPMTPTRVYCSEQVPYNAGRVAVTRGPVVYALEQKDNGEQLWNLRLRSGELTDAYCPDLLGGVVRIIAPGVRENAPSSALYGTQPKKQRPCVLVFVPYYAWGNRGEGEMEVFVRGD